MHPAFLEDQLDRSLKNLGLESIDIYYLHNVFESFGCFVSMEEFFKKLGTAFEFLESKRAEGKIKEYGLASYLCFRAKNTEDKLYLNLQKVVELAEKVGGKSHGF